MEFRTIRKFDIESFDRIKKRINDLSVTKRGLLSNPEYAAKVPSEIDIQLTHACNLRCKMCYEWNEDGYFKSEKKNEEIDIEIIKKILDETESAKSHLYLWGGEPLMYSKWNEMASLLEKDPRYTTLCTNGTLIEKQMDPLLRISSNLALLVSIDGLDEAHDDLRGKGAFNRLIKQIDIVLDQQRKGNFKGTISVNAVLNDMLIPNLFEFLQYFEQLGVDSVYLNYPWYISSERAAQMDDFFEQNLLWLNTDFKKGNASWYSYTFKLSDESVSLLQEQIKKISARVWKIRIRFQQHIKDEEIGEFVNDTFSPARKCFALANRLEVLADGRIGTCCKFFSEFVVGDLNTQSLYEIWHSSEYKTLRNLVHQGLMPVCSKCILLYRNGI